MKTVFVIGAGASKEVNLPMGSEQKKIESRIPFIPRQKVVKIIYGTLSNMLQH